MVHAGRANKSSLRRPVVGVCGFFGHGNYGDELFLSVFHEYLGDDFELRILPDLTNKPYFSRPIEELVAEVDAILIGGGDLVQPWSIDPRYFNRAYLAKPVFIVGVGVPIRPKDGGIVETPYTIQRLHHFFNHENICFFNVRDEQSRDWIVEKTSPRVEVLVSPDIVCALTFPKVKRDLKSAPVLGIVTRLRPNRDVPDDYAQLRKLADYARSKGYRVRHLILGTGIVGARDEANAADLHIPDKEVVRSEDLDVLSRAIGECSALVSMKFHGTVAATMYGVPSMVGVATSKNRNFMRRIAREELVASFNAADIVERFTPFPPPIDPELVSRLRTDAQAMLGQLKGAIHRAVSRKKVA